MIAAVSGVPVTLLKANDPNLASAQVGFASYMRDTIHPYLVADAEFLNQSLLPLFGGLADGLFLAYDNPVQEDEQLISGIMQSQVAAGIRTINEARSELGLDPAEDGDELRVNGIPLDVLGQPALPPLGALAYGNEEEENRKATRSEVRVGSWVEWRTEKGKYLARSDASKNPALSRVLLATVKPQQKTRLPLCRFISATKTARSRRLIVTHPCKCHD